MHEIVPGVHQVSRGVNAFIIDGDQGVVLIDTGLPGRHGAIVEGLSSIGRSVSDLSVVVLTHAHADHSGGAAQLKRESGATLMASESSAAVATGERSVPVPTIIDFPIIRVLSKLVPKAEHVEVDHTVSSGEIPIVDDLTAVPTPGHTPGHVSFVLDRAGGVLFAGDSAVATRGGGIRRGPMNRKTTTFDESLRVMAGMDFEVACFGHSRALTSGASSAFRRFVDRL